jgi:hypothetical protein
MNSIAGLQCRKIQVTLIPNRGSESRYRHGSVWKESNKLKELRKITDNLSHDRRKSKPNLPNITDLYVRYEK